METTERTAADAFIETLVEHGVTTIYGVPGEETTALMRAIDDSNISFVLCRHEQAAAFMAGVHGRITNGIAACLSTLGPGATNLITGVADATLDHVPMLAITGQGARGRMGRESHQMIDLEALFAPVTKQSRTIYEADAVPGAVAEAIRSALEPKPGAVHLCLPEDVASSPSSARAISAPHGQVAGADPVALARAAESIAAARTPLIVAGAGVVRAGAADQLRALAEATNIPLVSTFMAQGVLPADHPLNLFTVGQPGEDHIDAAFAAADLVVSVGFDPIEFEVATLTRDGAVRVVHLDESRAPADAGWRLAGEVTGALCNSLQDLRKVLDGRHWAFADAFAGARDAMRDSLGRRCTKARTGPVAPQDICAEVSRQIRPEDTVLSGVGLHKLWIARHVMPKRAGQVIIPNGLAGMGLALPGAIAAARLARHGRVLAICGDGDILMNVQDMETAARLSLDLTVMVWEDGGYGLIDEKQAEDDGDEDGPRYGFGTPNWDRLAHAFGWVHARVDGLGDLRAVLSSAHDSAGPVLLSVPVDYEAAGGMP